MAREQVGKAPLYAKEIATKGYVDSVTVGGFQVLEQDGASGASPNFLSSSNLMDLWVYVLAGTTYYFDYHIMYTAGATATGSRWCLQGPAFTELSYRSEYSLTAATRTFNEGLGAYNLPATTNASSASLTSNLARVQGFIKPSATGFLQVALASESGTSAITAKAGSFVTFRAVL